MNPKKELLWSLRVSMCNSGFRFPMSTWTAKAVIQEPCFIARIS